jgi:SAM-dependent methyltransferase
MNDRDHWNQAYINSLPNRLGWYRPSLETPLEWIRELAVPFDSRIIDVGGGASTLVDDLLADGYRSITVLDISDQALAVAKARLGSQAEAVTWLNDDIRAVDFSKYSFDLWHDRAAFHFLIDPDDQIKYLMQLRMTLNPGGYLFFGVFAPESPPKCSGLPVQRYNLREITELVGSGFEIMRSRKEPHTTPGGVEQMYLYTCFRCLD